jgi:hypothetical protein
MEDISKQSAIFLANGKQMLAGGEAYSSYELGEAEQAQHEEGILKIPIKDFPRTANIEHIVPAGLENPDALYALAKADGRYFGLELRVDRMNNQFIATNWNSLQITERYYWSFPINQGTRWLLLTKDGKLKVASKHEHMHNFYDPRTRDESITKLRFRFNQPPDFTPDGTRFVGSVFNKEGRTVVYGVVDPATGIKEVHNIFKDENAIPGLAEKTWRMATNDRPLIFPDGNSLLMRIKMDKKLLYVVVRLDPVTHRPISTTQIARTGTPIRGLTDTLWRNPANPQISADGTKIRFENGPHLKKKPLITLKLPAKPKADTQNVGLSVDVMDVWQKVSAVVRTALLPVIAVIAFFVGTDWKPVVASVPASISLEAQPIGLSEVREPSFTALRVVEVRDAATLENAAKLMAKQPRHTYVLAHVPSKELSAKIAALGAGIDLPMTDDTWDLARAIEVGGLNKSTPVELFTTKRRWTLAPTVRLQNENVATDGLSIRIYLGEMLLDVVRDMGLVKDVSAFFDNLRRTRDTAARAA